MSSADHDADIPWSVPAGVAAALVVVTFWPILAGQVWVWGLPGMQYYPWYAATRAAWQAGQLPLWTPAAGGGEPLLAAYQVGALYPFFNLVYQFIPAPQTIGWLAVLHVVWAGLGMVAWVQTLPETTRLSAAVAGLAYGFSGVLLQRIDNFAMLAVAAWTPWMLWAVTRMLARPSLLRGVAQALIVALLLVAGHAQWGFYALLFAGLFALAWVAAQRLGDEFVPWSQLGRRLLLVSLPMLAALALAAAQLLPTAELLANSARSSGLGYDYVVNFSLSPLSLGLFLTPFLLGNPGLGTYLPQGGTLVELQAYLGLAPLLISLGAVKRLPAIVRGGDWTPRRGLMVFFGGVAVVGVLIALGGNGPLFPLLYRFVPTFAMFQAPGRWLLVVTLALGALVGLSLPGWRHSVYWTRLSLAGALMAALGGGLGAALGPTRELRVLAAAIVTVGVVWALFSGLVLLRERLSARVFGGALLVLLALDLGWAAVGLRPTYAAEFYTARERVPGRTHWPTAWIDALTFGVAFDETPPAGAGEPFFESDLRSLAVRIDDLRQSELPNLPMLDGGQVYASYNPLRPARAATYAALLDEIGSAGLYAAAAITRDPAGAPVAIRPADTPDLGRAWVVWQAQWFVDAAAVEAALRDPAFTPGAVVYLEGVPVDNGEVGGGLNGSAGIVEDTPNRVVVRTTSSAPGWLVLADTYYPGWRVTVNGELADILPANLAFRAVAIPAGESEVVFMYQPRSWALGVGLSGMAWMGWLVVAAVGYVRRRDERH